MRKGKEVRSFTAFVPQPDLSKSKERVSVRFHADSGDFEILLPGHIALAVAGHKAARHNFFASLGSVRAPTLAEVEGSFKHCCAAYEEILRTEQRKRVIFVRYQRNRMVGDPPYRAEQIPFALTPALGLDFEVLWSAGGRLYRQHDADSPLESAGVSEDSREGAHVIDWTPEREAFFERLHNSLCGLIERLDVFMRDAASNVDLAIAAGTAGLLLPGPEEP